MASVWWRRSGLVASAAVLSSLALSVAACGGSSKKVSEPEPIVEAEPEEEEEELIPEEKFEEIQGTFERKANTVARCFPLAVEAGEVGKNDRVQVNVGLRIQPDGSPTNIEILGSSKPSETLDACVIEAVGRWQFPTLPSVLEYSYGFKLQTF